MIGLQMATTKIENSVLSRGKTLNNDFIYIVINTGWRSNIILPRELGMAYVEIMASALHIEGEIWGTDTLKEKAREKGITISYLTELDYKKIQMRMVMDTD